MSGNEFHAGISDNADEVVGGSGAWEPAADIRRSTAAMNSKKRMQLELLNEIMKEMPDLNKLRMLQTFDVDYSVKDPQSGMTVLHHGAFYGEVDLLQLGIEAGLSVDENTKLGRTPLHFACAGNQRSAVTFLLRHKADVNAKTCAGLSPLHLAVRENAIAAIKSLLFSKEAEGIVVDTEIEDMERKTPIQMAQNKTVKDMLNRYKRSQNKDASPAHEAPKNIPGEEDESP